MSSIPHFRTAHSNDFSDHTAPGQTPDQGSRSTRRTRYREWADYGAPPLLPIRAPTAPEVWEALLQRRMSPTQHNVLQHLLRLSGARSWCYFSTVGWVNALTLARTQLLRARRELVEQHILYYQEFPPEPAAPYLDQPNNGWIGFYPPGEWLPRTKHWGGTREGAGRPKKQLNCNNLISQGQMQASCSSLISECRAGQSIPGVSEARHAQASGNSLIVGALEQNQLDNVSLLEQNQLDNVCLPRNGSAPGTSASLLMREGSKKRKPVSDDTSDDKASPLARRKAEEQETDERDVTVQNASRHAAPEAQRSTLAPNEGQTPPTAEFGIADE